MQVIKPRRPFVAALLSAILPGFGQVYNGEINRGIWVFIAFAFLSVPWLAVGALYAPGALLVPVLLLSFLAALLVWVFSMVDAWRHARARPDYAPPGWQTSGLYALIFIVGNLIALQALTFYVRAHFFEPFRIPSVSMEPSVLQGDFLIADKRYNCPGCKYRIEPGDIAIMAMPNDRTRLFIKRIIAMPGDHITIQGQIVRVNGQALSQGADPGSTQFIERSANGREWTVQWDATATYGQSTDLTVPPGEVFVLGDNRSNSLDSRQQGTVPLADVVGRARQIWFSYGADGVRWGRIGRLVR